MKVDRSTIAELPLFSLAEIDVNPNAQACGLLLFDIIQDDGDDEPQLVLACGPDQPLFVAALSMAATRMLALALLEASSDKEKN